MMLCVATAYAEPLGTAFTYQGQLKSGGTPVTGAYDLRFSLWDAVSGGAQVGSTICLDNVSVSSGLFTVSLDFGAQFNGDARFLQVAVKAGGAVGDCAIGIFTTLTPRQPLNGAPYALYATGPWATSGANIYNTNTGNVGIGVTNPTVPLEVAGSGGSAASLQGTVAIAKALNETGSGISVSRVYTGFPFFSSRRTLIDGNEFNATFIAGLTTGDSDLRLNSTSTADVIIGEGGGNVGIGTTTPAVRLHIDGGSDTALTGGGFLVLGDTAAGNISIDNNEIMARNNGATATLFLNHNGGDVLVNAAGTGSLGVGTSNPTAKFHVLYGTTDQPAAKIVALADTPYPALDVSSTSQSAPAARFTNLLAGPGIEVVGTARVDILEITGADVAEKFPVSDEVQPGMVVMIDTDHPGQLCLARGAYNRRVAGVISGANGLSAGTILGHLPGHEAAPPVALSGRVWVHCDASEAAIEPGDLLTTANTPGHAMKVTDYPRAQGAAIGKAMTALAQSETGLVLVLINLQ
jgi:hypothetical protein